MHNDKGVDLLRRGNGEGNMRKGMTREEKVAKYETETLHINASRTRVNQGSRSTLISQLSSEYCPCAHEIWTN